MLLTDNSPIHIAVEKSHGEIVQMLLKEGATVYNMNMSGDGVIHVAARNSSPWILEMLREKGCDLDRCSRDGSFPLHLAAESGNLEAAKWFLLQGANPFSLDANGKTATDRAAETKQQRVVEWLRDHKAINEKKDEDIQEKMREKDAEAVEMKEEIAFLKDAVGKKDEDLETLKMKRQEELQKEEDDRMDIENKATDERRNFNIEQCKLKDRIKKKDLELRHCQAARDRLASDVQERESDVADLREQLGAAQQEVRFLKCRLRDKEDLIEMLKVSGNTRLDTQRCECLV
nr:ankyrin-3-like [Penaeus vannamei]